MNDLALDQALLTASAWQRSALSATNPRDAQFEHRACRIAADIYDDNRDLSSAQLTFLTQVHQIGMDCARLCGEAKRTLPEQAALAVEWSARKRRDERYEVALAKYEADRAVESDE
jgi:hypothetical protein